MTTTRSRTWLITGASRGLGRAFATAALGLGDRVVATMRDPQKADPLPASDSDRLLVLQHDVRDPERASEVADEATRRFGGVDVLVNNAGYGLVGAIEELEPKEILAQLETNLLGTIWNAKAVLPQMRERGAGEIVQISTVGAVGTMPMFGLYNASKWALEGYSEAMAAELQGTGVGVTIAELGGFRTDWGRSSMRFASSDPAYDELRKSVFGIERFPWDVDAEPDDTESEPEIAAKTLISHLDRELESRPLRLLVGDDAPAMVRGALELRRDDYETDPAFSWPEPSATTGRASRPS